MMRSGNRMISLFKRMFSVMVLTGLIVSVGCKEEKKDVKIEPAKEKVTTAGEPFLAPAVLNVTDGEDLKGDEAALRDLIISYNEVLVKAQIHMEEVKGLKDLTTREEFERVDANIKKDRVDGKIMSCTLNNLQFKKLMIKGEEGTVKTSEDWFFEDRDRETGKIIASVKDFEYDVEYRVIRKDNKWFVGGVTLGKISEYRPIRGTPKRTRGIYAKGR